MFKDIIKNKNNLFVGLIIILSVIVGLTLTAFYQAETSSQSNNYTTYADVQPAEGSNFTAGFDDGMNFGILVEESSVTKSLELTSTDFALVTSSVEGNISEGIEYHEKVFFQNETSIDYRYNADGVGYFEGEILLDIKTADNYWGEQWLKLRYYLPF